MNELEFIAVMPHIWIVAVAAVAFTALTILCVILAHRMPGVYGDWVLSGWFYGSILFGICAVVAIPLAALLPMPYEGKYLALYRLTGTVESVTNEFVDGSGSLTGSTVAYIAGYPEPVVLQDNRLMTLVGQDVSLTCTISWVPYGMDVTHCGLNSIGPVS